MMKLATCSAVINKAQTPKEFELLATEFVNKDLTKLELANEVNQGFAFSTQHKGRRQQDNFVAAGYIGLDFDRADKEDVETILADPLVLDYYGLFYYTPSSTPDAPRFRIVFELEQTIYDSDYYKEIVAAFIWKFSANVDKNCSDPCRLFYGSKNSGPTYTENTLPMSVVVGVLKTYRAYLEQERKTKEAADAERRKLLTPAGGNSEKGKKAFIEKVLSTHCDKIRQAPKGERHHTLRNSAQVMGGYLAGEPMSIDEYTARQRLEEAYSVHENLDRREMKKAVDWGFEHGRKEPLFIAPLPEHKNLIDFSERAGQGQHQEKTKVNPEPGEVIDNEKTEYIRPRLCVQAGDLHSLNPLVWDALKEYNNPPHLFRYGSRLQRFEVDGEKWSLQELNPVSMRFEIIEAIDWFKIKSTKDEDFELPAVPPRHIAENLLVDSDPELPTLHKIVETPIFTKDGVIITEPGYHASGILYHPAQGLVIEQVPTKPTKADIDRANSLIEELLYDFPFTNPDERANAISIFLDPFLREMIKGPTPLRLIEASTPGSGKGLLADVLTRHATRQPGLITQCHNEEEWNKSLISQLKANASVILIDNISTVLDSGSLAAALTSDYYGGRMLGTNETLQWPNRSIWLATANNPTMTTEIARRTVRIRLDPKQDRPWQREDFKHTDLRSWADEHRAELIWAALTIIQHWLDIGKPNGKNKPLGSFEHWSKTMGGVLEAAGYAGFLNNLEEFYEVADLEGTTLRSFVNLWWDRFGGKQTTTSDLFALTMEFDGFDLGKGGDRSQRMVFGKILGHQRDKVIGKFMIVSTGQLKGLSSWKLTVGGQIGF